MFALLCVLCLTQAKGEVISKLTYSTPAGTAPTIVQKVASQMEKRIKNYGYKGVSVYASSVDDKSITVAFEPGFSPAMIQAIDQLATIKGQAFLWACMNMTQKEGEQWIPGKTSPPGTSWFIDENNKCIMDDSHKIPMDVRFERFTEFGQEKTRLFFVDGAKKFSEHLLQERSRNWKVMLDGKCFSVAGMLRERTSTNGGAPLGLYEWVPNYADDSALIGMIAMGNPLPVELSARK
jgi:hypothetical protein